MAKKDEETKSQSAQKEQPAGAAQAESGAAEVSPEAAQAAQAAQAQQTAAQQQAVTIDDSTVTACYANFCRVSSTPEELILDLGLNPQPMGGGPSSISVSQRIILNHFTAKRLLSALTMAVQRHEQAFGVLETDVRKRVVRTS